MLSLLGLLSAWSGMVLRCLNPPAGGRAFLGMAPGTTPLLVLIPVLSGSMLLLLKAGYQPPSVEKQHRCSGYVCHGLLWDPTRASNGLPTLSAASRRQPLWRLSSPLRPPPARHRRRKTPPVVAAGP